MPNTALPILVATAIGFATIVAPDTVSDARGEFSDFLDSHDQLHLQVIEEAAPEVVVRKAYWNDESRILFVDAETSAGKGSLVVVEGLPVTDWVTAFTVAKSKGVSFQLPIPENELVPCRIIVRSAHAFRITRVIDAPPTCVADAEKENMLLASIW
ncbi:MAG: hypothetical protein OEM63_10960 [Gammaproteobacteria bacterium]|nr:hypothetical protein [Gammaproteobacteria bacterium]